MLGVLLGKLQGDAMSDEGNGGAAEGSGGATDSYSKGEKGGGGGGGGEK
jgi:hypothetical protein